MKLNNMQNILPKRLYPTTGVIKAQKLYVQTGDIFVKSDSVREVAASFKKNIFDSVSDWDSQIPSDKEDGASLLKKLLAPYTVFAEKLIPHDSERFVRLAFGENQVEFLEKASLRNKDVMLFKTTLEKTLGKTIREVVVK